jgi:hypothetical protein
LLIITILKLFRLGYFSNKKSIRTRFLEPVPNATSKENIQLYRNRLSIYKDTGAVVYSKDAIENYLKNLGTLTGKMQGKQGCSWAIGFYPMHKLDENGKNRLDFLVVPTAAKITCAGTKDEKISDVFDFHKALFLNSEEIKDSPYMDISGTAKGEPKILANIGFDTGHIYP